MLRSVSVLPLRFAFNLFAARRDRDELANRTLRESATLRAAADVWSDVASMRGLGFRSNDAGPLLYGDLPSGATLEVRVFETSDTGEYRTVATARPSPHPPSADPRRQTRRQGRVLVRPHDAVTRIASRLRRAPALDAEVLERFFVRATPPSIARERLPRRVIELLMTLSDRAPHLYLEEEDVRLVLEGVELVHERMEAIVDGLSELTGGLPREHPFRDA